jgi:putative transposase
VTTVDKHKKHASNIPIDAYVSDERVTRVLNGAAPRPTAGDLRRQGPLTGNVLDCWDYRNRVTLRQIRAGKPTQNAYVESFNREFRDDSLDEHWFRSLAVAREIIAAWRANYHQRRPRSALGYQTLPSLPPPCVPAVPCTPAGSDHSGYAHQRELYEPALGTKTGIRTLNVQQSSGC